MTRGVRYATLCAGSQAWGWQGGAPGGKRGWSGGMWWLGGVGAAAVRLVRVAADTTGGCAGRVDTDTASSSEKGATIGFRGGGAPDGLLCC